MPTIRLSPNGQGTRGTWTTFAGGTTGLELAIDDYISGGAHNSDTDGVMGPNVTTDVSMFVLLQDTPADFNPANLTSIEIRRAARMESAGVSNALDSISLGWQLFRADEATAITTEVVTGPLATTYGESTFALTVTGTHTKADWDGARLRIRQVYAAAGMADTTARARVSAVEAVVNYTLAPKTTPTARLSLGPGGEPSTRTAHSIKLRARKTNAAHTASIRATLYEGATARSTELTTGNMTTALADYTLALTDTEAAAITSYADLELRVRGYSNTGDAAPVEIAEVWLETPAVSSGTTRVQTSWQSSYTTATRQAASWESSYEVAAGGTRASAAWTSSYTTLTRATTSWSSLYGVAGRVTAGWVSSYVTNARPQASWDSSWVTRSRAGTSWASSYIVRARGQQAWSSSYATRALVTQSWASSYITNARVTSAWASSYTVVANARPTVTWASSWITRARIGTSWVSSYGVRGRVPVAWTSSYTTRARVSVAWASSWTTHRRADVAWASSWTTRMRVAASWQTSYVTHERGTVAWTSTYTAATGTISYDYLLPFSLTIDPVPTTTLTVSPPVSTLTITPVTGHLTLAGVEGNLSVTPVTATALSLADVSAGLELDDVPSTLTFIDYTP